MGLNSCVIILLVPLRDVTGTIQGVQFISPDGTKKFKTGTAKQGNYFSIGKPQKNTLLICEGYATGASLHESTGHAVAVAFDAGNLKPVAENLRKKFPEMKLIICADNDESGIWHNKKQKRRRQQLAAWLQCLLTPATTSTTFTKRKDWQR